MQSNRKLTGMLLVLALLVSMVAIAIPAVQAVGSESPSSIGTYQFFGLLGDVNDDSVVNIKDVTHLQKYLAKFEAYSFSDEQKQLADVLEQGKDKLNVKAATMIQKYIAKFSSAMDKGIGEVTSGLAEMDFSDKIVILHTNDVHSRVQAGIDNSLGYAAVVAAKKYYKSLGADVLLVDAGDTFHGLPIANLSKGANIAELMNDVGYNAMAPGNHDFNYGYEQLATLDQIVNFPILSANFVDSSTDEAVFKTTETFEIGTEKIKIAFIGITTPETATKASPLNTIGHNFSQEKIDKVIQAQIDAVKDDVDFVIGLGHLGVDQESAAAQLRSTDIIKKISGLNVMIDAHSHTTLATLIGAGMAVAKDKTDKKVKITSAGNYLQHIGALIISKTTKSVKAAYADTTQSTPDEVIADKIAAIMKDLKPGLNKILANTQVPLDGNRNPGVRVHETNLGDLAADAIRYISGADVALTNGGGIRVSLPMDHVSATVEKGGVTVENPDYIAGAVGGDITYGDLNAVFPFGNLVVTTNVLGSDIVAALEHGTKTVTGLRETDPAKLNDNGPSGGFPQVSGITFTVDVSKTENRVQDVKINGVPVDLAKKYVLATNDFTKIGGDGYVMLNKNPVLGYYGALDEALISYVTNELGGVIDASSIYADKSGDGRITFINVPAP